MGYLTPILIRNDSAYLLNNKKLQKQICEKLHDACCSRESKSIGIRFANGGGDCNAIEALKTEDANVKRIIVVYGNTWIDLWEGACEYEKTGKDKEDTHNKYFLDCMDVLERELKYIKEKCGLEKKRNK